VRIMNKIIFLLMAGLCGRLAAQTNAPLVLPVAAPAAKAPARPKPPTEIDSDSADFDLNSHQAIYRNHVVVVDPKVRMTCEWMLVDLPQGGEHLNHVVASTNVVVDFIDNKGQTNHVTAAQAVYDYKVVGAVTNETVTFTGNPVVEMPTMTIFSEPLVWDRGANKYHFTEPKMIPKDTGTNGPAQKLF
jgi:lipopolysaccharide export system protein LptA